MAADPPGVRSVHLQMVARLVEDGCSFAGKYSVVYTALLTVQSLYNHSTTRYNTVQYCIAALHALCIAEYTHTHTHVRTHMRDRDDAFTECQIYGYHVRNF